MGQTFVKNGSRETVQLLEELQVFALFTLEDIRELHKRFRMQIHGFALVKAQFENIIAFKNDMLSDIGTDLIFEILDNDHDGRIDGLELLGGLTLCCRGSLEERARFCFELYDFNLNATLSIKEMVMMMMTSICGMNMLTGGGVESEPDLEYFETISTDAFNRADRDGSGQISFEEFVAWIRSSRELMSGLESLSKIASEAIVDLHAEDSAEEADEGDLSDVEAPNEHGDHFHPLGDNSANPNPGNEKESRIDADVMHWRSQIAEPLYYFPTGADKEGPLTNLELKWAYGYKSKYSRSNLFYCDSESNPNTSIIVYPTAALGVVYDSEKSQQSFYQGHKNEVTCMNIHPNTQIVVTGDTSSNIHIWNAKSKECICQIKGLSKQGVQHVTFSPSGDRIATVGLDPDHTVAVYDASTGEIVSSGKGIASPCSVHDIAYSSNGTELVIVGTKQIKFFTGLDTSVRSLKSSFGKIGKQGKRQTFFSCAYFGDDCIVGCASGELYRFKKGFCVQIVQAHGPREAVLCIQFDSRQGVIVTGGKDSLIKTWDLQLKEVGTTIDMSEDLDGDGKADSGSLDSSIVSVQLLKDRVLVGTRGGDILEVKMPVNTLDVFTINRLAWSHSGKGINCLVGHPTRDEFVTCGDDKTFRLWSIRSHEQLKIRALPYEGTALAYTVSGNILALGLEDGSVALMDAVAGSFRVYFKWKHCSAAITDIKFSPDSCFLVVACADHNIYMYKGDDAMNFKRYAICRGHSASVTHIDISASSTYLQSTSSNGELMFWDLQGRMIKDVESIRDVVWSSYTSPFGWHVQGIWPLNSTHCGAVHSCASIPDVGDIVVGHDDSTLRLYRYPSIFPEAIHQSYIGHSSFVRGVAYSYNRRYVISAGGEDGSILLWKHEVEQIDDNSDCDDAEHDVHDMQLEDLTSHMPLMDEAFAEEAAVKRWRSGVVDPTNSVGSVGATDVDLELRWIHGYRSRNSFNNVRYSSAGAVVYTAAAVGVVFSKSTWKQHFLQGAHSSEILSIAAHPSGQLFATGDSSKQAAIVVWNAQEMTIVSRIEKIHHNGVSLLAFSNRGHILASAGLDNNNSIFFLDWSKGVPIMTSSTSKAKINCMCFLADTPGHALLGASAEPAPATDILVTAGDRHIKFWWSLGQNVKSQRGLWGARKIPGVMNIHSVASATPGVCVTGSADGNIIIWRNFRHIWDITAHPSPFTLEPAIAANVRRSVGFGDETAGNDPGKKVIEPTPFVLPTIEYRYPHHRNSVQALWGIAGRVQSDSSFRSFMEQIFDCDDFEKKLNDEISKSCRYLTGDKDGNICIWLMLIDDTFPETVAESSLPPHADSKLTEENIAKRLQSKPDNSVANPTQNALSAVPPLAQNDKLKLYLVKHFKAENAKPKPTSANIRSLCERDGSVLIGTLSSDIFEVLEDDMPFHKSVIMDALSGLAREVDTIEDLKGENKSTTRSIIKHKIIRDYVDKVAETRPLVLRKLKDDLKIVINDFLAGIKKAIADTQQSEGKSSQLPRDDVSAEVSPLPLSKLNSLGAEITSKFFKSNASLALTVTQDGRKGDTICAQKLLSGHYRGELWGLACHPLLPVYFTAGDDGTLRCWSLVEHKMMSYCTQISGVSQKIRAIDIDPNGDDIAVALSDGNVYILKIEKFINPIGKKKTFIDTSLNAYRVEFSVLITPASIDSKGDSDRFALSFPKSKKHKWSSVVKYSSDTNIKTNASASAETSSGTLILLAVASSDKAIYLFNKSNKYEYIAHASIKDDFKKVDIRERSWIYTHVDFGVVLASDSKFDDKKFQIHQKTIAVAEKAPPRALGISDLCIQCATDSGDLIYYRIASSTSQLLTLSHDDKSSVFKDAHWLTWTSPFGWPVQGIWTKNASGEIDINSVTRSKSWAKVPVVGVGSDSGAVQLFNYPCVNTGAPDKCYKGHSGFVTNVSFSCDDSYLVSTGGVDNCIFVWSTDVLDELKQKEALGVVSTLLNAMSKATASPVAASSKVANDVDGANEIALPSKLPTPVGDQFAAVKPWKGAIREPSDWRDPPDLGSLPDASLELKAVYGYRGWDCRNNVSFGDSAYEVVYHIAAVGVVYNSKDNTQVLNTEHDDDIICLSVHPAGHTVATGEIGKVPKIVIWDANTGITVKVLKYHKKGVSNISWSGSGTLLISIGMDDDRTVCVHNAKTGNVVGLGKVGRGIDVYCLNVMGDSNFITGGKNHVKFWDLPSPTSAGGELSSKSGSYHKSVSEKSVISASFFGSDFATGMKDGKVLLWKEKTNTKVVDAHTGPCTSMCCLIDANAGKGDGSQGPQIVTGGSDGLVHIWNLQLTKVWSFDLTKSQPASVSPQVHSLNTREGHILLGTKGGEIYEVNILNSNELFRWQQSHFGERLEAWGLAVHPNSHKFVTAGDDGSIRLWDAKTKQQIKSVSTKSKTRAVCYSPDGFQIAAASFDGRLRVFSADLQTTLADVAIAREWSQAICFSPNGLNIAVGSHDNVIYLLDTKTFSCRAKCLSHHSYITGIDFSEDSTVMRSTSGDYELLFWDVRSGKQITSASAVRDVKWATTTCPLGWSVQGVWPANSDGTDVNAVDKSNIMSGSSQQLIVTGDDFRKVKIFRHPCIKEKSSFKAYKGHSENVMNIKFSHDNKYVYSIGGLDKAILQFEVKM